MRSIHWFLILSLISLAACNNRPPVGDTPIAPALSQTPPASTTPGGTPLPPTSTPTPPGPVALQVWVPPEFDPAASSEAGALLQQRLDEFSQQHAGIPVEVRVKAVSGPGGLLDSLTTASAAAPRALPDLIALPRDLLETAAIKGLLIPYDNLTNALDSQDWYEYARQLAHLQNSIYGMPFAGDAMFLAYRSSAVPEPPVDWTAVLTTSPDTPLVFPAADPQALFTLALYQANGGAVLDEQGRPYLDTAPLTEQLNFYAEAEKVGVMPSWLTQLQGDDQVWDAFQEKRADLVATWASRYLSQPVADAGIAPIPTPDGEPFTLATGWVWALVTRQDERQALSVELAEFLTESEFLAEWTRAVGYLPPRPSSLSAWPDSLMRAAISPVVLSAELQPSADVLASLGGALQQATLQVLTGQEDAVAAAQSAAASLTVP